MTKDEAMKLALEALEPLVRRAAPWGELDWLNGCKAITALREALEEQPAQQEPYGYVWFNKHMEHRFTRIEPHPDMGAMDIKPIYTSPAQRTWVGLTDEEITDIWAESSPYYHEDDFARAIEAKLRSKNEDRN